MLLAPFPLRAWYWSRVQVHCASYPREICAFKIHGQELPFEAVVLNKTSGEGRLRAKSPIDCELQKEYTFIIQAYDCGAGPRETAWKKSHKAVVHIQVKDVNEFAPAFKEPAYRAVVTEGKIYDSILQVEAVDEDCSPQYSQICNYEIVTTDVPFAIDRNGNIRNTEKLSYDKQHQYEILVTAYDCGQKPAAQDTLVQVDVKPVCKPGWQGPDQGLFPDSSDALGIGLIFHHNSLFQECRTAASAKNSLLPVSPFSTFLSSFILPLIPPHNFPRFQAQKQIVTACRPSRQDFCFLGSQPPWIYNTPHYRRQDTVLCVDWTKRIEYQPGSGSVPLFPDIHLETCDGAVSSIQITTELQTNYIGKGCDRETYSEKSLQKLCGASSGIIDLLPSPSAATNWTAGLLVDSSEMIFKFDGRQGAKIPDGVVPKNLTDQFTITMWMKHGPSPGLRAEKETILCNSDKTEMNRHHYALYVHNCRLVFLLRKDFDQADTFRPAEFHWKLDQPADLAPDRYGLHAEKLGPDRRDGTTSHFRSCGHFAIKSHTSFQEQTGGGSAVNFLTIFQANSRKVVDLGSLTDTTVFSPVCSLALAVFLKTSQGQQSPCLTDTQFLSTRSTLAPGVVHMELV
ncbi:hypothetical protein CB1_001390028 [Camelus ferus]|nr:hypothetical protein CB1_001390028 [Camelus ferus]